MMKRGKYFSQMMDEMGSVGFWRDVISECLATFLLVSVQCALPLTWDPLDTGVHPKNTGDVIQTSLGMGFVVMGVAGSLGDYGGAHMNPAVSIAMAICTRITVTRALFYIVGQCAGSLAGAAFIKAVTPEIKRGGLATTTLSEVVQPWQGVLIEAWITLLLVLVILGATNSRWKGQLFMPNIVIGFTVTCGIMCAYSSTGASMNPARSLGPAIMMGIWDHHWVYWAGPIAGGVLASIFYLLLDRPGRKPANKTPGKYELEELNHNSSDGYKHVGNVGQ